MIRTTFIDDTHWDLGDVFLSLHEVAPGRWRAAIARLSADGDYRTVSRSTHRTRTRALSVGMRALRKAAAR